MQKLSESIAFVRAMYVHPSKPLLAQWQDQAEKLEGRVASVEQAWVRDTRDLKEVISARYEDISDLKNKAAELQRMNDNQFAQLEANDKTIKELQQDNSDSEARAENLNDKLRATKAELEGCRVAYKGKKEQVDGLYGQLRERDQIIVALRQEGEHLRRSISENANTVALNKHIANLTSENQRQKNTIRQLEDQNKNLEAALVKAEGQVRCLQGVVDTQTKMFHAVPTPSHDLSVRLERQRRTIDELREDLAKVLKKQSDETERADYNAKAAIRLELDARALQKRNDNQFVYIRECQEEIRKLREQLETEKAKVGSARDPYEHAQVEVRILNAKEIEVIERIGTHIRVRLAKHVFDEQPRVQRRSVAIDSVDLKTGQVLGTVAEHDVNGEPLFVFRDVPINGLLVTTGA